jgi:hypothetical protein
LRQPDQGAKVNLEPYRLIADSRMKHRVAELPVRRIPLAPVFSLLAELMRTQPSVACEFCPTRPSRFHALVSMQVMNGAIWIALGIAKTNKNQAALRRYWYTVSRESLYLRASALFDTLSSAR